MASDRHLFENQDYYEIKDECLREKKLFCDEFFKTEAPSETAWRRPHDIVDEPVFFSGEVTRFDVRDNERGNWLMAAIANLTTNPTLFDHVVPKNQSFTENYAGIFRFNIWQCGSWTEVVVDDQLPTEEGPLGLRQLVYAHSKDKVEFWSVLLEKAYAKLFGSYDQMYGGTFEESIVDLTGGMVERVDLKPTPDKLWSIISKSIEKGSLLCVFIYSIISPEKRVVLVNGLATRHHYKLTDAKIVSCKGQKVHLVRLTNPFRGVKWKGAWCDSSPEWKNVSVEDTVKCDIDLPRKDGDFWMSLKDLTSNFTCIDICHLTLDHLNGDERFGWKSHFFKGEWTSFFNAGGFCKETFHINPQYRITLKDTDDDDEELCTIIIGLRQVSKVREEWCSIGITVFRLDVPEKLSSEPLNKQYLRKKFEDSSSSEFKCCKEVVIRDKWEPGVYSIIPSTALPNQDCSYYLRVFTEKKTMMEECEPNVEQLQLASEQPLRTRTPNQIPQGGTIFLKNDSEVFELFQKIAGDEGKIDWEDLQTILEFAVNDSQPSKSDAKGLWGLITSWVSSFLPESRDKIFTKDMCQNIIAMLNDGSSRTMDFDGFCALWKNLQSWESIYLLYVDSFNMMTVKMLNLALKGIGYDVEKKEISRVVRKYGDTEGLVAFDEFVMCCMELDRSSALMMTSSRSGEAYSL